MKACNVDVGLLRTGLVNYLETEFENLVADGGVNAKPTAAFQRVVQRAVIHVQGAGRDTVTGAQILLGLFSERESTAAWLLGEQNMTRLDAANFIAHGIVKGSGGATDGP
jgi:ATP-dependent Clp protease ATP-binding subunit ClpA